MRKIGIILNILGIILTFVFFASYFTGMSAINDHLNSVAITGGSDGPTSIFYTVKINRNILLIVFALMAIFAFNLWSFVKKRKIINREDANHATGADGVKIAIFRKSRAGLI